MRFLVAFWLFCAGVSSAFSQSVAQFYATHDLNLYVSSTAGGPYDAYARLVGAYINKYLPGSPHVIVRNMPGAGGIIATNFLVNVVDKDGASFALVQREAIMDPLMSGAASKAQFDPLKLTWIGTPNQEIGMVYMSAASGAKTIEDAQRRELLVAAAASTSGPAVYGRILNMLIGTKFKIILGYGGTPDALLAIQNGEADGRIVSGWAGSERATVTDWVSNGKARLLMQISAVKSLDYPDLPYIMDYAKNDDDRRVMEFLFTGQLIGNPFIAAPGIPPDRATALRDAFAQVMKDPQFVADAKTQLLSLSPISSDEMLAIMRRAYATPAALQQRALDIYNSAQQ